MANQADELGGHSLPFTMFETNKEFPFSKASRLVQSCQVKAFDSNTSRKISYKRSGPLPLLCEPMPAYPLQPENILDGPNRLHFNQIQPTSFPSRLPSSQLDCLSTPVLSFTGKTSVGWNELRIRLWTASSRERRRGVGSSEARGHQRLDQ